MNSVILGNIQVLDQLSHFLEDIDDTLFQEVLAPLFQSSVGQHVRHVLDMYLSFERYLSGETLLVDYNFRRRGSELEKNKASALNEIQLLKVWLPTLVDEKLFEKVEVKTEVNMHQMQSDVLQSTLARELSGAANHLFHHLATMASIARIKGVRIDNALGLAPATASFLRSQEKS